ncbi:MAG TPA: tetratricopeptide repeat protein [Chitinophagaceae bacterium]|nr:tetratricopeptide repeat protein [Chitinophagaceae bacterium]
MDRIEKIRVMLAEQPGDPFLLHALALEYIKGGQEPLAREVFTSLLRENPGYVGSYYHLAKLLERTGETDEAVRVYQQGMEQAARQGDRHALNELRSAYDELTSEP